MDLLALNAPSLIGSFFSSEVSINFFNAIDPKPGVGGFACTPSFGTYTNQTPLIAHVVTPRMNELIRADLERQQTEEARSFMKQLTLCYQNPLEYARNEGIASVCFPALSCGIGGTDASVSAKIGVTVALSALGHDESGENGGVVEEVLFVCYESKTFAQFQKGIEAVIGKGVVAVDV